MLDIRISEAINGFIVEVYNWDSHIHAKKAEVCETKIQAFEIVQSYLNSEVQRERDILKDAGGYQ